MSESDTPAKRRRIDDWSEVETARFIIPNFRNLPVNDEFKTPIKKVHDTLWYLKVTPYDEDVFEFELACFDGSLGNTIEGSLQYTLGSRYTTGMMEGLGEEYCEFPSYAKYKSELLECLDEDGNLVVHVDLKVKYHKRERVWYPKQNLNLNNNVISGKSLLESPHVGTDISFLVGNDDEQEKVKAHKIILFHRSLGLYEFIKDIPQGEDFVVADITPTRFKDLLLYIYAGTIPKIDEEDDDDKVDYAKTMLQVADRYNLVFLKLFMESEITSKLLCPGMAAEWLVFADRYACPLLKEACMKIMYTADNLAEVKASPGWKVVKESSDLLEEVLEYHVNGKIIPKSFEDFDNMSVRMLREKLDEHNLDLDGTKAMLIQRLKDHHGNNGNIDGDEQGRN